jgi:hypothetical protein
LQAYEINSEFNWFDKISRPSLKLEFKYIIRIKI